MPKIRLSYCCQVLCSYSIRSESFSRKYADSLIECRFHHRLCTMKRIATWNTEFQFCLGPCCLLSKRAQGYQHAERKSSMDVSKNNDSTRMLRHIGMRPATVAELSLLAPGLHISLDCKAHVAWASSSFCIFLLCLSRLMHQMDPTWSNWKIWNLKSTLLDLGVVLFSDCINLLLSQLGRWGVPIETATAQRRCQKYSKHIGKTTRIVHKYRSMHDPACRIK